MKNLIYYPGFEVQNEEWLKFALLYLDNLRPIIPTSGGKELSMLHLKLINDTDLIKPITPDIENAFLATLDSIEMIESIMSNPGRYFRVFKTMNIVDSWKNPKTQSHTLYEEKYDSSLRGFCIKEGLAQPSDDGIVMNKQLCLIYMSLLSQAIADSEGVSPITDSENMNEISILTRRVGKEYDNDKINAVSNVIELYLPSDIKNICIDDIIEFRNTNSDLRKDFQFEFENLYGKLETGDDVSESLKSYLYLKRELSDSFLKIGAGVAPITLGVLMLFASPPSIIIPYLKEIASAASFLVGSTIELRNGLTNTKTRRNCKKYLARIKNNLQ